MFYGYIFIFKSFLYFILYLLNKLCYLFNLNIIEIKYFEKLFLKSFNLSHNLEDI